MHITDLLLLFCLVISCPLEHAICDAREMEQQWPDSFMDEQSKLIADVASYGETFSFSSIFNVLDYGAKGDGKTDDTKAFEAAWLDVCGANGSKMWVPSGYEFLVGPLSFSGPHCVPGIVFQLDGKIVAPTGSKPWGSSGLLQWLEFSKLQRITITGNGIIDGQGAVWWQSHFYSDEETRLLPILSYEEPNYGGSKRWLSEDLRGKMPKTRPTALRFYGSSDVVVTGITIQNSPKTHLKFDNCSSVQVFNVNISSPGDSPNTDGIHLQNSQNVVIHHTDLGCGDDCVSIQAGCSSIYIHDVNCGPGHGISIGGLGKDKIKACVSNVTVRNSIIQNALTGVRIKTWQGGSGLVQGIMFANIQVSEVKIPIVIDQYYCNGGRCRNQTSAVAISGVSYQSIKGTYTTEPVYFACSDSKPCTGVTLDSIELTPFPGMKVSGPFCWKTYGELRSNTTPPIDCLQTTKYPVPVHMIC